MPKRSLVLFAAALTGLLGCATQGDGANPGSASRAATLGDAQMAELAGTAADLGTR